jgi:hypothetical protein
MQKDKPSAIMLSNWEEHWGNGLKASLKTGNVIGHGAKSTSRRTHNIQKEFRLGSQIAERNIPFRAKSNGESTSTKGAIDQAR